MAWRNPFRRAPAPRVAAAAPLTPGYRRSQKRLRQPWQERAEYFATALGAVRFASGVGADACSRCTLRIEHLEDPRGDVWEPVENSNLLADLLRTYRGKTESQRELVRQHAWLEDTVGEALQFVEQDGRRVAFSIRSPLSTEWRGDGVLVRDVPGGTERDGTARLVPYELVRRMWIPNETWPGLANSPLQGVMEDCELYWTTLQKMQRDASSALIGNGILWTPSEAHTELAREQSEPGSPGQPATDLERDYYAVAQRAFEERDSIEANAPLMMRWRHEYGPPAKIDLAKELDSVSMNYLTTSLEGIARGLNYPSRMLVGGGAGGGVGGGGNHWCADEATEILTAERGWVAHDGLASGDIVLTLNHESGLSEWQPVDAVNRFHADDEDMVAIDTAGHSSLTTLNHRWPVLRAGAREWTTSERLGLRNNGNGAVATPNKSIILGAPCAELPTEAKYEDALVELVGWFWTEGSAEDRPGRLSPRVTIYQSGAKNPQNTARIRRALTALYGPESASLGRGGRAGPGEGNTDGVPRWRVLDRRDVVAFRLNAAAAAPILAIAPDRLVSLDFVHALTPAQLELFIETSVKADGSHMGATRLVFQKDRAMLAAVEVAAILAGYATNLRSATYEGFERHDMWVLRVGTQLVSRPKGHQIARTKHTGIVWCPTTANHTWLARREGRAFFTGNSDWLLQEQFAKEAIAPKMERIAWGDISTTFLRPALRALGAKGLFFDDPEMYRVGFDMAPIVVHPDQSQNVLELYKLGVASDSAALEYAGLDPSVAPDRVELGRWAMRTQMLAAGQPGADPAGGAPVDASTVTRAIPAAPAMASLDVGSRVLQTVPLGPLPGEEHAWLDG